MGHDDDLVLSKLTAIDLVFHNVFSSLAFGSVQKRKKGQPIAMTG
jgi:hypothetical protein